MLGQLSRGRREADHIPLPLCCFLEAGRHPPSTSRIRHNSRRKQDTNIYLTLTVHRLSSNAECAHKSMPSGKAISRYNPNISYTGIPAASCSRAQSERAVARGHFILRQSTHTADGINVTRAIHQPPCMYTVRSAAIDEPVKAFFPRCASKGDPTAGSIHTNQEAGEGRATSARNRLSSPFTSAVRANKRVPETRRNTEKATETTTLGRKTDEY